MWELVRAGIKLASVVLPKPLNQPFENVANVLDTLSGAGNEPSDRQVEFAKEKDEDIQEQLESQEIYDNIQDNLELDIIQDKKSLLLKAEDDYNNQLRIAKVKEARRKKRLQAEFDGIQKFLRGNMPGVLEVENRAIEIEDKYYKDPLNKFADILDKEQALARNVWNNKNINYEYVMKKAIATQELSQAKDNVLGYVDYKTGLVPQLVDTEASKLEELEEKGEITTEDLFKGIGNLLSEMEKVDGEVQKEQAEQTEENKDTILIKTEELLKAIVGSSTDVLSVKMDTLHELSFNNFKRLLEQSANIREENVATISSLATTTQISGESAEAQTTSLEGISEGVTDIVEHSSITDESIDALRDILTAETQEDRDEAILRAEALQKEVDRQITDLENDPYEPKSIFEELTSAVASVMGIWEGVQMILNDKGGLKKVVSEHLAKTGMKKWQTDIIKGFVPDIGTNYKPSESYTKGNRNPENVTRGEQERAAYGGQ